MAVLDFTSSTIAADVRTVLVDALAQALEQKSGCRVLSSNDMRSIVEFESLRQTIGCDTQQSASCLAELGGALGVGHVITGDITDLGDGTVAVTARKLAIGTTTIDGRANVTAKNLGATLREAGPRVAAILLGEPDPGAAEPAHADGGSPVPGIVTVTGALVVAAGAAVVGIAESQLATPAAAGTTKQVMVPLSQGGLIGAGVGVAVLVAGVVLIAIGD